MADQERSRPSVLVVGGGADGAVHLAYRSTNDKEADGLYDELKKILNHVGMADHHVLDKNFYMHMDVSVAGVAPVGHHLIDQLA